MRKLAVADPILASLPRFLYLFLEPFCISNMDISSLASQSYDWCSSDNRARVSTLPLLGNLDNAIWDTLYASSNACVIALISLPDELLAMSPDLPLPSIQSPVMFPGLSVLLALKDRT